MILLLPVGSEAGPPRTPRVVLALAGACLLATLLTSGADSARAQEEGARLERVAAWTLRQEAEGLPGLAERVARYPSALAFLRQDASWREAGLDPGRLARLERVVEEHEALARGHPSFSYGLVPARLTLAGLVGHMFLHAGWLHLAFNMLFLWVVGGALERLWGGLRFATLYLASGLAAAGAHVASDPRSLEPAVGASGAVAGAMGAFAVAHAREPLRVALVMMLAFAPRIRVYSLPAWLVLGLWAAEQVFFASFGMPLGVAFEAHLGGFACGALAGLLWRAGLIGNPEARGE